MLFYTCFLLVSISNTIAGKSALVLIADGSEEMESVTILDILRRGNIEVTLAGVSGTQPVTCSNKVVIVPDTSLAEAVKKVPYDAVVLPGGMRGSTSFAQSAEVGALLKEQEKSDRLIAAICAAPTALKAHGIGLGKKLTSYPSFKKDLAKDYVYSDDQVVVDGKLVTSQGPGTAANFALKLVEFLAGAETEKSVRKALLL